MKKSEAIREIWEVLESDISPNHEKAKVILEKIMDLGFGAPEIQRNVSKEELLELSLTGYDISEDDFISVREWETEDYLDKDKLN